MNRRNTQEGGQAFGRALALVALCMLMALGSAYGQDASRQSLQDRVMDEQQARQWVNQIPEQVIAWLKTIQHQPSTPDEPWGLFTFSVDSKVPYSLPSTALAWLVIQSFGGIEKYPGYPSDGKSRMAAFLQKFQEPKTGVFIDPALEARLGDKSEEVVKRFRADITKWTRNMVMYCGAQPLYPYSSGGAGGTFDTQAYLKRLREADWTKSWEVGSHAGFQTVELFEMVNRGRDDCIPALEEGIKIILQNQNAKTGMWGREDLPLEQQLGGALKVILRFQFNMGLIVPHMERLADSLIRIHKSPDFSRSGSDTIVARNVAELAYACMAASDYRKQELRPILVDLISVMRAHEQPDGGFSRQQTGKDPIVFHGASIAPASQKPRGDIHGLQSTVYALENVYHWLGWTDGPWPPRPDWREELARREHKYTIQIGESGEVSVRRKAEP